MLPPLPANSRADPKNMVNPRFVKGFDARAKRGGRRAAYSAHRTGRDSTRTSPLLGLLRCGGIAKATPALFIARRASGVSQRFADARSGRGAVARRSRRANE